MTQTLRTRVENTCILVLFCLSLGMFALSFLHRLPAEAALLVSTEMGWMVQRASAVVLLCLCAQLRKRKHTALIITQSLHPPSAGCFSCRMHGHRCSLL